MIPVTQAYSEVQWTPKCKNGFKALASRYHELDKKKDESQ